MRANRYKPTTTTRLLLLSVLVAVFGCLSSMADAQQTTVGPKGEPASTKITATPAAPAKTPATVTTNVPTDVAPYHMPRQGTEVDRVVAIIGDGLILESDIDEERRFAVFNVYPDPRGGSFTRQRAMERLIDRTLILQQLKLQPQQPVSDADVDKQIADLRREIPACKAAHCETDAGWKSFLAKQGFTPEELKDRWRERMQVLGYVEQRFRGGAQITPEQIQSYYTNVLTPEYRKDNATPPRLATISGRIQEVLLQQQISDLLDDWLKSLRAQGTVQILQPGEEAP
jgi:peptidyl-prolyl cis-trans isomerase SurA